MKQRILWPLFIIFSLLIFIYFLWRIGLLALDGRILGNENIGKAEYLLSELENNTIEFFIDGLVIGKHDLLVYFIPYDSTVFQQMQKPIKFELTVQIQKDEEIKEKTFAKIFGQANSRGVFYLFDVPYDFLWTKKAKLNITIKDISFDEEFIRYYQAVSFNIVRLPLFGHKINIVDGERIKRKNGFRTWQNSKVDTRVTDTKLEEKGQLQ
jgi:hypothetical protein